MIPSFFKSLKICFLPLGDKNIASSRLRCYAYLEKIREESYSCKFGFDDDCDLLYIQKKVNNTAMDAAYRCKKKLKTMIFDIDDFPNCRMFKKNSELLVSIADVVTTSTPEQKLLLCNTYPGVDPDKVFILPNPIDYTPSAPIKKLHRTDEKLKIVWFGNVENFPSNIVEQICTMRDIEFHAITNFTNEIKEKYSQCHFIRWSYDIFPSTLSNFDVCVLSHFGNEIHGAKNSNKMITAIAHGVPVVASQTADYIRIANLAGVADYLYHDKVSLLEKLEMLRNASVRNLYLHSAQPLIWKYFNIDSIFPIFLDIVQNALYSRNHSPEPILLKKLEIYHMKKKLENGISHIKSRVGIK